MLYTFSLLCCSFWSHHTSSYPHSLYHHHHDQLQAMKGLLLFIRLICLSWTIKNSLSFGIHHGTRTSSTRRAFSVAELYASYGGASDDNDGDNDEDKNNDLLHKQLDFRVNEIKVEQTRELLEKAHVQSFLKRKPRKLPYKEARIWVQANLGCETEEEWYDAVANGHLRTPYIPKSPKRYYTETREWISWDHFLLGIFDNNKNNKPPCDLQPPTGIFD